MIPGVNDFTLVVDNTGEATSDEQRALYLNAFAVKCDALATWQFDVLDKDGFPVFSSDSGIGSVTGPGSIPIERRCANFRLTLKRATPGTYLIRCSIQ